MNSCKITFFSVLFLLVTPILNAQVNEPTPLSPQIAAFQQYGDINVNLSTGVPNISVPLMEINHFGYRLPISLDYFPTPLRPGYNYDVTGVGWNLSLRSHVSRKLNYLADESKDFVVRNDYENMCTFDLSCLENFDVASDVFTAKLPDGSSFDFSIVKNSNNIIEVVIFNGRPVKVDWVTTIGKPGITSFDVTDESGIVYTFDVPNKLTKEAYYYTEWHLSKIKLPNSQHPIVFEYDNFVQSLHYDSSAQGFSFKREFKFLGGPSLCKGTVGEDEGTNVIEQVYPPMAQEFRHRNLLITRISYGLENIWFTYDKPKKNPIHPDENFYNYLDRIEYKNRAIEFNRTVSNIQGIPHAQLTGLDFKNAVTNALLSKYQFINETFNINNGRTDHWGYLNGAGNGESGVGNFVFSGPWDYQMIDLSGFNSLEIIEAQDMHSLNNQFVKYQFNKNHNTAGKPGRRHGKLEAIIYPTGGKTEFEFERHKFLSQTRSDGVFIEDLKKREVAKASGFRIKTITNKDSNGNQISKKNYRYGKRASEIWDPADMGNSSIVDHFMVGKNPEQHTNVGEVVVDPNLLNFLSYTYAFPTQASAGNQALIYPENFTDLMLGKTGYLGTLATTCRIPFDWEISISAKNFQKRLNGRPQVVYPYVTVYDGNYVDTSPESTVGINGKTEYVYDLMEDFNGDGTKTFIESIESNYEEGLSSYYGGYFPQSHRYNNLLEQKDYAVKNNTYSLIKKETTYWAECSSNSFDLFKTFHSDIPFSVVTRAFNSDAHITAIQDYIQSGLRFQFEEYYDMKPSEKSVTMYSDDGSEITATEWWLYTSGGRLTRHSLYDSKGKIQETVYSYPSGTNSELSHLVSKNIINVPVGIYNFYDDKFVSAVQTKYDSSGRPTNVYASENKGVDIPSNPNSIYKYPQQYTYSYNTDGRMNESTRIVDSYKSVYLWDSTGNYVMAKIENVAFNLVSSLDGKPDSYNSKTYYDELQLLVSNDALITTYTYNSTGNITQQTDPRGYTTYYEYDNFNRLKAVKDADGNILSENEYNYKQ